jgi:hypothetical protein
MRDTGEANALLCCWQVDAEVHDDGPYLLSAHVVKSFDSFRQIFVQSPC